MGSRLQPVLPARAQRSFPLWPFAGTLSVAAAAVLAVLVFSAGPAPDEPSLPDAEPVASVQPGPTDAPAVRPATDDEQQAAETTQDGDALDIGTLEVVGVELFLPRDPFDPVRPEPEPDEDEADDAAAEVPGTTDPDSPEAPSPPPTVAGPTLSVQEVFTTAAGDPQARITLGESSFTVAEGDVFEVGYTVTEISGECVTVATPGGSVTACTGESVATPSRPVEGCRGGEQLVCEGQVVTLVEITTSDGQPAAVIQVGEDRFVVTVGERFASNFELLSIGDDRVRLVFGDEVYTLLAGGGTLK